MADVTESSLGIVDQAQGGNDNTWGDIADANFLKLVAAGCYHTSVAVTGGDTTLSLAQQEYARIIVTGALTSNQIIRVQDAAVRWWFVENRTTGDYTVEFRRVSDSSGMFVPQNTGRFVNNDASTVRPAFPDGLLSLGHVGTFTENGDANTLTVSFNQFNAADIPDGAKITGYVTNANTGNMTLNFNAIGVKKILYASGGEIPSGGVGAASIVTLIYHSAYNGGAGAWVLYNGGGAFNLTIDGSANNLDPFLRINSDDGLRTSYTLLQDTSNLQVDFRKVVASGAASMLMDPMPADNTSAATWALFRNTNTAGAVTAVIYRGNGSATIDHRITAGAAGVLAEFAINGGEVEIGGSGNTAWHDANVGTQIAALVEDTTPDYANDYLVTSAGQKIPLSVLSARQFFETKEATNDATVEFTGLSSAFAAHVFEIDNLVPNTNNRTFGMRTSNSGSWDNGTTDYAWAYFGRTAGGAYFDGGDADDSLIRMLPASGSAADSEASGRIIIFNPGRSKHTIIQWEFGYWDSGGLWNTIWGHGVRLENANVTNVQFFYDTNLIATGTFRHYGIRA